MYCCIDMTAKVVLFVTMFLLHLGLGVQDASKTV